MRNNKTTKNFAVLLLLSVFVLLSWGVIFIGSVYQEEVLVFTQSDCEMCTKTLETIDLLEYNTQINIRIIDIDKNQSNKDEFVSKIQACNLNEKNVGVPLLYYQNNCTLGAASVLPKLENLVINRNI